jgi:penicillin-binding protein 1C
MISSGADAGVRAVRAAAALAIALGVAALALDARRCSLVGPCGGASPPSFAAVRAAYRPSDVRVLDRHGEVVHEVRVDRSRRRLEWTPLAAISPALLRAVIACEDRRFAAHGGVDARALAAGAWQSVRGGRPRGGSTISMQLAAMLGADGTALDPAARGRRGVAAKWRQIRGAIAFERTWTKSQILEAYLNLVAFRGEISGVAAAAHLLLGKAPHAIGDDDALALAALLRAPNATRDEIARRAGDLAARLAGSASGASPARVTDGASGASAPPGAASRGTASRDATAPDAAAIADAAARVANAALRARPRVALAPHAAARLLAGRGSAPGDVRSTLDAGVQRFAVEALDRNLRALAGRNASDGAVLVVDNASGDVLAWVGGSGTLSAARYVDGVVARRQAGSTLKPFLYGLAIDRRQLTAASLLEDLPLALPVAGGVYRPRNYDEGYRGLVSLRDALAGSLNVPAVRTLGLIGVDDLAGLLRGLGFASIDRRADHYGPALALGAAEVTLAELVNGYRAIANGGDAPPLRLAPDAAPDVGDGSRGGAAGDASRAGAASDAGGASAPGAARGARRLSPEASFIVADVLADRDGRSATFGLENPLATRFWAAVKTGTSKDMRDNWCVGFSTRYTVGVWVGNHSGAPMHDVSGVSGAAPAWLEILSFLHRGLPDERPSPPPGVVRRRVSLVAASEAARDEWFLAGSEPATEAVRVAAARPRIESPVAGSAFAIDPDIPPANQRIPFATSGDAARLRWRLDGRDAGEAVDRLWRPEAGRHRLALVDGGGAVVDQVAFEVRGAATAAASAAGAARLAGAALASAAVRSPSDRPGSLPSSRRPPRSPVR